MINEINVLLDKYALWLKDKTVVKKIGEDWIEITTPHIDRHNDCLQIYARKDGQGYMLTDDGIPLVIFLDQVANSTAQSVRIC